MRGRWEVLREVEGWSALDPECHALGPARRCRCRGFETWAEAMNYADRMSRREGA